MVETLYLTGAVAAFSLLMVTLFIIKLWSDGESGATQVSRPKVTPAQRPVVDIPVGRKAA